MLEIEFACPLCHHTCTDVHGSNAHLVDLSLPLLQDLALSYAIQILRLVYCGQVQ